MTAFDWVANNYDQAYDTPSSVNNFGGYDAVNVYGDEEYSTGINYLKYLVLEHHRQGYNEMI